MDASDYLEPGLPLPQQRADPLAAIASFAAHLRDHGFQVGVAEQQTLIRVALAWPAEQFRHVSIAWRAVSCRDVRDWHRWEELFDQYWYPFRYKGKITVSGQTRPSRDLRQVVLALHEQLAGEAPHSSVGSPSDSALTVPIVADGEAGLPRAQGGASQTDALHDRELSLWLPQDLALLERLAEQIAQRLRRRLTRRWHQQPRGTRLDIRRTLRDSLRTGGIPVTPAWSRQRKERPKLFILVDVSRSMQTHAQLFLRIARAFVGTANARVFVFHTRLAEVTPLLQRDSGTVQEKVNAVTAGFSGGTRIATSVADFHRVHARAQLGRGARVWVLSDGFDADPPDRLRDELARVCQRGARITWFHPTRGRPASMAMQQCAALIHRYVPLASLRDLSNAAANLN